MNTVRTYTLLGLFAIAALTLASCRGGPRNPFNKCCDPCGGCTAPNSAPATQAAPAANAKPADAGSSCGGGSESCGGGKSCG